MVLFYATMDCMILLHNHISNNTHITDIKCSICGRIYNNINVTELVNDKPICECRRPDKGIVGYKLVLLNKIQAMYGIKFVDEYGYKDEHTSYPWICRKCKYEFWSTVQIFSTLDEHIPSVCPRCTAKSLCSIGYSVINYPYSMDGEYDIVCLYGHRLCTKLLDMRNIWETNTPVLCRQGVCGFINGTQN
jgi:hypothetical protein